MVGGEVRVVRSLLIGQCLPNPLLYGRVTLNLNCEDTIRLGEADNIRVAPANRNLMRRTPVRDASKSVFVRRRDMDKRFVSPLVDSIDDLVEDRYGPQNAHCEPRVT